MRRIPTLLAAVALAFLATGCVTLPKHERRACYWMTEDGSRWVDRSDVATKAACFELDSCSGGQGMSGGGCYKWSTGADKPGVKW